jgi:hypothetical protein
MTWSSAIKIVLKTAQLILDSSRRNSIILEEIFILLGEKEFSLHAYNILEGNWNQTIMSLTSMTTKAWFVRSRSTLLAFAFLKEGGGVFQRILNVSFSPN